MLRTELVCRRVRSIEKMAAKLQVKKRLEGVTSGFKEGWAGHSKQRQQGKQGPREVREHRRGLEVQLSLTFPALLVWVNLVFLRGQRLVSLHK